MGFRTAAILFWIAVIFFVILRSRYRGHDALMNQFLKDEHAANAARRKALDPSLFYVPDLAALPPSPPDTVVICAAREMIRFPQKMSNLALKHAYGVANLERITQYEENYNRYISALIAWAESLMSDDHAKADAVRILEETLALGSEFRKTYRLLADYYADAGATDRLCKLDEQLAATEFTDTGVKRKLAAYLAQAMQKTALEAKE